MSLAHGIAEEKFLWVDKKLSAVYAGKTQHCGCQGDKTPLFDKDKGLIV